MPKTVLVVCSDNSGKDFPREENQIMLKKLLGDDFIVEFMDRYPENLPSEHTFNAVLFAGCNVLTWLFNNQIELGMEKLSNILKKDGIIIFVENQAYIDKLVNKSYSLSIPLEEMKLHPVAKDDKTGLKQNILNSWEKFFQLDVMDKYFVYKLKTKEGGKSMPKRKIKTTHKKKKKYRHKTRSYRHKTRSYRHKTISYRHKTRSYRHKRRK
jgi:hypothetical protein